MSQECPRCRLLNPDEALRCDCGYDFASRRVEQSYLLAHVLKKHGGAEQIVENAARTKIRTGSIALALAATVSIAGYLTDGRVVFLRGAFVVGALLLYRGLRQRRQRALDSGTIKDLLRRS